MRPARIRTRYVLRAVTVDGRVSGRVTVRSRDVTLASVGDVNVSDVTAPTSAGELRLSTRGVEGSRFRRAVIEATRPRLL